jgi:FkbM family methyltransferase
MEVLRLAMDMNRQPSELRTLYETGSIGKLEFIKSAYQTHQHLFTYPRYLEGTNIDRLEIRPEGVIASFKNPAIQLWCPPGEERHTTLTCLDFREYETSELQMLLRLAKRTQCFIDIGANAGFYSIAVAKTIPSARIYSFEPIPSTYSELCRNLALNGVSQVHAMNLGLADLPGELTFYFDSTVSGAASSAPLGAGFETSKIVCQVTTLDAFVKERSLAPDLIKCDVEGGELKTFLGARETLEKFQPIVFTEMLRKWAARFGYHPNELIDVFESLGYQCFSIAGDRLTPLTRMTDQTVETNFFFLHNDKHIPGFRNEGLIAA